MSSRKAMLLLLRPCNIRYGLQHAKVAVFANAFGSIVLLVLRAVIGTQQGRHQPCSRPRSATCSFLDTQSSNRQSTWFSAKNITEFSYQQTVSLKL